MRVLVAALNVLAALVVAIMVDVLFPDAFTNAQQYFLGIGIFVLITVVEILFVVNQYADKLDTAVAARIEENRAREARTELDKRLGEVQALFHQLDAESGNSTDLFYEYHKKKLSDLEKSLRDACVKQQTQIDETMFAVTTWLLDSSFHGRPDDIMRAVLPSGDQDFFFDVHTRMYFIQMYALVQAGRSEGVKRLIVVDDPGHLLDPRLERLVAFHNGTAKYACRAISRAHFDRIVSDYRLQHLVVDFGIYGQSYLYKGLTNHEDEIVGIYSKDASEIKDYITCFESCWNAASDIASSIRSDPKALTVDWVFGGAVPPAPESAQAEVMAAPVSLSEAGEILEQRS